MNDPYNRMFELKIGLQLQLKLKQLFERGELIDAAPVQFRFDEKSFVLEIQYFCSPVEDSNYDRDSSFYRFAVTSDGFDLLVDIKNNDLPIIQDEFGSREDTGLTIGDLLNASIVPIR
ncbi:MAG: hypothetical protein QM811_15655 [Pirellulales bacterium]